MKNDEKIKYEKLQYDTDRAKAKIFALSFGKIDKYNYLTGEEILPLQRHRIREEVKFTYLPLGKALQSNLKSCRKTS